MLNENIKNLRKSKGMTQEELAARVNVVRQTVSKWEKGLSVPDAEMLQRIAEVLDTSVSRLLEAGSLPEAEQNSLAEQLARINEQLVIKNRRAKTIWRTVGIVLAVTLMLNILLIVLGIAAYKTTEWTETTQNSEVIVP